MSIFSLRSQIVFFLMFVFVSLFSQIASSAVVTYTNKAIFLADTGAVQNDPIPNVGLVPNGTTVGTLTFSGLALASPTLGFGRGPGLPQWSSMPGNEIGISGKEDLLVETAILLSALGFDFFEPTFAGGSVVDSCGSTCTDSTFAVELFFDDTLVGSTSFNADDDVAWFFGISSTSAFNRVEIAEAIGESDNDYFGQFYTAGASAVPVPPAVWLFGSALGLLGWMRRKAT